MYAWRNWIELNWITYWSHIFLNFQIWRLFTAFVYYPIVPQTGFHYLINLYFLYSYSTRLETGDSNLYFLSCAMWCCHFQFNKASINYILWWRRETWLTIILNISNVLILTNISNTTDVMLMFTIGCSERIRLIL